MTVADEAWRQAAIAYRRSNARGTTYDDPADPLRPFYVWVTGPAHRMNPAQGRQETNNVRHALSIYSLRELVTEDIEALVDRHPRYLGTRSGRRSQVKSGCRRILRHLQTWLALEDVVVIPDGVPAGEAIA